MGVEKQNADSSDKGATPQERPDKSGGFSIRAYVYNWITLVGVLFIIGSLTTGALFFLLELTTDDVPAYLGIIYALLLLFLVIGLVLVPVGMVLDKRRQEKKQQGPAKPWVIDFSKPSHQIGAVSILVGGLVLSLVMAVGSYKVYEQTESNEFCGQLCHSVMQPEYASYHFSSHARVKCVACHIGSGAGWFVRAKISGLKQILAVTLGTYPRPIPTPISDLRPARETCEECHWPSKFIGFKEFTRSYYLSNEKNSQHQIRMLMKIGGEKSKLVAGSGIHYHMLIASKIEYIARDDKRQIIPWVRISRPDGSTTTYSNTDEPLTEEEKENRPVRAMDCMDCHNRPSHKFPTPMHSVNTSIEQGLISPALPFIKVVATQALDSDYPDSAQAMVGIANHIRTFYRKKYPDLVGKDSETLKNAIAEVQRIYQSTLR